MKNIRSLTKEELLALCEEMGEKKFRATQLWEWLWLKSARSFDQMTNLSKEFRAKLAADFSFPVMTIANSQRSSDGTIKYAFRLDDGFLVEGVLIPTSERVTACISSQVGCSLSCTFCATGFMKRERNLRADEMYDQVAILREEAAREYGINLSNIVLMGMGEPLLNYANVMGGIERITSPDGLGMSPQRITLSTSGITKMIKKLGDDGARFNLALSLHSANNEQRSKIMPITDTNSLEDLIEALNYFYDKTGTRVTLEYCVINDINDDPFEAEELVAFCRKIKCKVNLIEYNPIDLAEFISSSAEKIQRFADYLEKNKVIVNVRRSRGKDIDAACGQLANKLT
ncbi:MAG: 23S rRNA (adenine2503-C2)-methyltransferase [Bacteroidia bacterium]|jgi:23S rRNA (adenine2503-C2)-methyltransferase|tara:strand:+ start:995 stop:2026 length:1032 start_codon:yes stop_codon:yes gene_type:complete